MKHGTERDTDETEVRFIDKCVLMDKYIYPIKDVSCTWIVRLL